MGFLKLIIPQNISSTVKIDELNNAILTFSDPPNIIIFSNDVIDLELSQVDDEFVNLEHERMDIGKHPQIVAYVAAAGFLSHYQNGP